MVCLYVLFVTQVVTISVQVETKPCYRSMNTGDPVFMDTGSPVFFIYGVSARIVRYSGCDY